MIELKRVNTSLDILDVYHTYSCPFCGSTVQNIRVSLDPPSGYPDITYVVCGDCGSDGPTVKITEFDDASVLRFQRKAIDLWNRRSKCQNT